MIALYTVDPADASTTLIGSLGPGNWSGLTGIGGTLYAIEGPNDLYSVEPSDASTTLIGSLGSGTWEALAVFIS